MAQRNHRDRTLRYLLITSGVLVVGGLGYLALDLLNPPPATTPQSNSASPMPPSAKLG
jgi:hypothetical protein